MFWTFGYVDRFEVLLLPLAVENMLILCRPFFALFSFGSAHSEGGYRFSGAGIFILAWRSYQMEECSKGLCCPRRAWLLRSHDIGSECLLSYSLAHVRSGLR